MARRKSSYLGTIEYIGPRPQKPPKRPNFLVGWLLLMVAGAAIYFMGKPLIFPLLQAEQAGASMEQADLLIAELQPSATTGDRLAAAALQRTQAHVSYSEDYYQINFPNGDIPIDKGRAEDLVVRSYRSLGIDLQQLVNEDMKEHFSEYPAIFGRKSADANIDHRLTLNLQRFFKRAGAELTDENGEPSANSGDYRPGDIVAWRLAGGKGHIGVIVPGPGNKRDEAWVVHNNGDGPVWENCLFDFRVTGHYRYFPAAAGE